MAVKNYLINDKWLDINKQNIVEVKSTDGVIGSVKLNGEEYGGGGGSSDFSTAEVTITNKSDTDWQTQFASLEIGRGGRPDAIRCNTQGIPAKSVNDYKIIMYKNRVDLRSQTTATIEVSGHAELIGPVIVITGDCTITIS